MKMATELNGVCLVEKDSSGDLLWVWSFPTVQGDLREILLRHCSLLAEDKAEEGQLQSLFGHFDKLWYYVQRAQAEHVPRVKEFFVILQAKDFNPEKYSDLAQVLAATYESAGGSPPRLLAQYMSVYTKGWCRWGDGSEKDRFDVTSKSYDKKRAFIHSSLKEVVQMFGIESILIYVALLLKKRVAVHSPQLEVLLKVTRALPQLVWHRQNWSIVYPHVEMGGVEVELLKQQSNYIMGSTDPSIESHSHLYDLFVNIPAGSVSPAQHAKEAFVMGKIHKEIAMFMLEASEDGERSEQSFVKDLTLKTRDLISSVRSLAEKAAGEGEGEAKITLEVLKARKLTPAMEQFLYSLASAEGMTEL